MIRITSSQAFKNLIKSNPLVLVDFYADWCGPCIQISPYLESLANKNEKVKFVKVNVDECEELAMEYRVSSIPYFVAFHEGQQFDTLVGASQSKIDQLVSKLELKI